MDKRASTGEDKFSPVYGNSWMLNLKPWLINLTLDVATLIAQLEPIDFPFKTYGFLE